MTAIELHPQRYRSMGFYWVNTNKASHDRRIECVEKNVVLVHVASQYLHRKDKRKVTVNILFFTANKIDIVKPGEIVSVDKIEFSRAKC